MMQGPKLKVTTPTDLEIVMTREFDAPRRLVWDAMTKPENIRKWLFLPPGWKMVRCDEDLRVGGRFRWEWAGPTGETAMVMHGTYTVVEPPARVVRTETFEMGCQPMGGLLASIELAERGPGGPRTFLTLTCRFETKEARDGMLASGMEQGVSAGYDQLDTMLASGSIGA